MERGLENSTHQGLKEPDIFSLEIKSLTSPPTPVRSGV